MRLYAKVGCCTHSTQSSLKQYVIDLKTYEWGYYRLLAVVECVWGARV